MDEEVTPSATPYEIVVGFDCSELSERALTEALDIAIARAPAELHVITIADPEGGMVWLPGAPSPMTEEAAREATRGRVAELVKQHHDLRGSLGIERVAIYLLVGSPVGEPGRAIIELARAVDAELIVVGTHGRKGLSRIVMGSVAASVVRDAPCSVHVVRPRDFVRGEKVPAIQAPLLPGQPHLKQFEPHHTYHYVDKVPGWTQRTMPVS